MKADLVDFDSFHNCLIVGKLRTLSHHHLTSTSAIYSSFTVKNLTPFSINMYLEHDKHYGTNFVERKCFFIPSLYLSPKWPTRAT